MWARTRKKYASRLIVVISPNCNMDVSELFPFDPEIGYLGLGLLSFFGSLVPFVPIPSFILLTTMSVGDTFNLHVLAILSAVLAASAKLIIFYASYRSRRIIDQKTLRRIKPFQRLIKRYGAAAAFVAAATPIPDDMVYVPLGLAKYNPTRFFLATLSGKLVLHYIIVAVSHYLGLSIIAPYLENVTDVSVVYVGMIIFGISLAAVVFMVLRLDWQKILGRVAPWTLDDKDD